VMPMGRFTLPPLNHEQRGWCECVAGCSGWGDVSVMVQG